MYHNYKEKRKVTFIIEIVIFKIIKLIFSFKNIKLLLSVYEKFIISYNTNNYYNFIK